MASDDDYVRLAAVVRDIPYLVLATVDDEGEPWNTPVLCAYDEELRFYWTSDREAQHSRNVRERGRAFGVIFDSTVPIQGKDLAVYLKMAARELNDEAEIRTARDLIERRKGGQPKEDVSGFMTGVRRVYEARPERAWVNDIEMQDGRFIRNIRVEINLAELRDFLNS